MSARTPQTPNQAMQLMLCHVLARYHLGRIDGLAVPKRSAWPRGGWDFGSLMRSTGTRNGAAA